MSEKETCPATPEPTGRSEEEALRQQAAEAHWNAWSLNTADREGWDDQVAHNRGMSDAAINTFLAAGYRLAPKCLGPTSNENCIEHKRGGWVCIGVCEPAGYRSQAQVREAQAAALREAARRVRFVRENGLDALPERVTGHPTAEHFEKWLLDLAAAARADSLSTDGGEGA